MHKRFGLVLVFSSFKTSKVWPDAPRRRCGTRPRPSRSGGAACPLAQAGLRSSGCESAVSGLRPSGVLDGLVRVRFVAPYEPARLHSDSKGLSRAACGAGPPAAAVPWCWACRCAPVPGNDTVSPAVGQDFTTCVTFPESILYKKFRLHGAVFLR